MRGAPIGNKNGSNALVAKRALERILAETTGRERKDALEEIWLKQINLALDGDRESAKLIIERLDGKPHQSMGIDGTLGITDLTEDELNRRLHQLIEHTTED